MIRNRIAAVTAAAAATVAIVSGCAVTYHGAVAVMPAVTTHPSRVSASLDSLTLHNSLASTASAIDPSVRWLESVGGQAQVAFNQDVDTVAGDLETEAHAPTVANHLVFETDARVMRAQALKILRTSALLPIHNRAAYKRMLNDFITVANLLQPGPDYGTSARDYAAWWKALRASNIEVW
jgi:propanediol dehydratase small subunit